MFWLNQAHASTFMPPQATEIATRYDALYSFLVWASFIASALVIAGFVWFTLKYKRRSENDKTAYISHNAKLEFLWSFIPFLIFIFVFVWGGWIYHDMRSMPEDAFEVHVFGQKWSWSFVYKSGKTTTKEFVVPVNKPVKLIMTSKDVLHSFYIPAFRIKQDVVPGRYTTLWFQAEKEGDYQVFCTEYCGKEHSGMLAKVRVVPVEEFERWLEENPDAKYKGMSLTDIGKQVYENYTCVQCHTLTGDKLVGPSFKGLFGNLRKFTSGSSAEADENYIRESVLNPTAKIVEGFPPAMPAFAGQLTELQISGVIEFLKTLEK